MRAWRSRCSSMADDPDAAFVVGRPRVAGGPNGGERRGNDTYSRSGPDSRGRDAIRGGRSHPAFERPRPVGVDDRARHTGSTTHAVRPSAEAAGEFVDPAVLGFSQAAPGPAPEASSTGMTPTVAALFQSMKATQRPPPQPVAVAPAPAAREAEEDEVMDPATVAHVMADYLGSRSVWQRVLAAHASDKPVYDIAAVHAIAAGIQHVVDAAVQAGLPGFKKHTLVAARDEDAAPAPRSTQQRYEAGEAPHRSYGGRDMAVATQHPGRDRKAFEHFRDGPRPRQDYNQPDWDMPETVEEAAAALAETLASAPVTRTGFIDGILVAAAVEGLDDPLFAPLEEDDAPAPVPVRKPAAAAGSADFFGVSSRMAANIEAERRRRQAEREPPRARVEPAHTPVVTMTPEAPAVTPQVPAAPTPAPEPEPSMPDVSAASGSMFLSPLPLGRGVSALGPLWGEHSVTASSPAPALGLGMDIGAQSASLSFSLSALAPDADSMPVSTVDLLPGFRNAFGSPLMPSLLSGGGAWGTPSKASAAAAAAMDASPLPAFSGLAGPLTVMHAAPVQVPAPAPVVATTSLPAPAPAVQVLAPAGVPTAAQAATPLLPGPSPAAHAPPPLPPAPAPKSNVTPSVAAFFAAASAGRGLPMPARPGFVAAPPLPGVPPPAATAVYPPGFYAAPPLPPGAPAYAYAPSQPMQGMYGMAPAFAAAPLPRGGAPMPRGPAPSTVSGAPAASTAKLPPSVARLFTPSAVMRKS